MTKTNGRINFFTLDLNKYKKNNSENIIKTIKILEKDRLIIINGIKNIGKINFIKEFLNKTNSLNNYFYYKKTNNIINNINESKGLENLLNEYIQLYKKPHFIILQDISKIEGIKNFISKIYKDGYKIILIGNNIKIGGIKEIEILNKIKINNDNILNIIKYGNFDDIKNIDNIELKEKYLKLLKNDIFLNDIFLNFSVKNIELYNFTLTYISNNNIFISLRELQKKLNLINKISLKTTIDYIDFSIQAKIIKKVYKFDIKAKKEIKSKTKYYFNDLGIRNSLVDFKLEKNKLIENLIFNILEYNNFKVFGGLNGKFEFTFYGEKNTANDSYIKKENIDRNSKIYIHISKQETKEELKKEINKLLKMGNEGRKYLLVESIEKLKIKKLMYKSVYIIEINDFLKNFGQK